MHWRRLGLVVALLVTGCATGGGSHTTGIPELERGETGTASFYGGEFHGRRTASGERYDSHALTAAHRTLPFGTRVRVTNLANDREVVVTITDRGPSRPERLIDLSRAAARRLGFLREGTARVRIEVMGD